jgi:hypothetical protein
MEDTHVAEEVPDMLGVALLAVFDGPQHLALIFLDHSFFAWLDRKHFHRSSEVISVQRDEVPRATVRALQHVLITTQQG